jgi:hypothetical protein
MSFRPDTHRNGQAQENDHDDQRFIRHGTLLLSENERRLVGQTGRACIDLGQTSTKRRRPQANHPLW